MLGLLDVFKPIGALVICLRALAAVLTLPCACTCNGNDPGTARSLPVPKDVASADADPCEGLKPLPAQVMRGVSFVHNYQKGGRRGYASEASRRSLSEAQRLGVTSVSLMPFGFMASSETDHVRLAPSANSIF